jgi:hypothetical protein
MPVFEAHVRPLKVNEEIVRVETRDCTRVTVRQSLGWWRFGNAVVDQMPRAVSLEDSTMRVVLPVHRRDRVTERLLNFWCSERINVAVDAASLFHGRNAASHPLRAANQFVIRCHNRPV